MIVSIHQPNFLPWYGFFHKIINSNIFIFFDNVQMPIGKSYVYRVKLLISGQENWLSVPVLSKSKKMLISDVKIDNTKDWKRKHIRAIELNYRKSPFFKEVFQIISNIYENNYDYLIDLNINLIKIICSYLNCDTLLMKSSDLLNINKETGDYIISLIKCVNGEIYLTGKGKGTMRYLDEKKFLNNNIKIIWQDVSKISYKQFNSNVFIPNLSILDMLFNLGTYTFTLLKD